MFWPILTFLIATLSIFIGILRYPHPVAPANRTPEVPQRFDEGPWAPAFPKNKELSAIGVFMAKGNIHFAETVFVKNSSHCQDVFATDSRGRVWALAPAENADQAPRLVAHVGGMLLGGAFDEHFGMYLADATKGLLYIPPDGISKPGKAQIVASFAPSDLKNAVDESSLDEAEIRYTNDIAVDPVTRSVYFTDSSRIAPSVSTTRRSDSLFAYGNSHLTGDASGRLLVYVPSTGQTHVLVTGIPFANGVGLSKDRSHVVFASTSTYSLRKVPALTVDSSEVPSAIKFKDTELFYSGSLPGMPDGLTVDREDGSIYVPLFAPVPRILRFADAAPSWIRRILVSLPAELRPSPSTVYTMIAQFSADGVLKRVLHDTKRKFGLLTSVDRCGKYLFCGSLNGNFAARFDLSL